MDFKEHIIDKLQELTGLEREAIEKAVETPPDEKLGDLAFPCFPLAKVMESSVLSQAFGGIQGFPASRTVFPSFL